MPLPGARSIAVVGAGWAGLAAAVECAAAGAAVTLFEMAPAAGGRARDIGAPGEGLDNGQHIAIGAYSATLALLAQVGVDAERAFLRLPLALVGPDGSGLRLPAGAPLPAFVRAVLARRGWSWRDRFSLLRLAAGWRRDGFVCAPASTVADLGAALPAAVRAGLIEPLCVAALNTPASAASGVVFLRVLRDALAGGRGASDLLLPRVGLSALLAEPALAWLGARGATVRLASRVARVDRAGPGWRIDGETFDAVVVAASAVEAARLVEPIDAAWSARARSLAYEPIVTVYLRAAGARLPEPMLLLDSDDRLLPAQFVFDRGRLGGPPGLLALVVSGAAPWVERGLEATEAAALAQARSALAPWLPNPPEAVRTVVEKRATFACVPMLERPRGVIATGLAAAGDYVEGPYPATLEGAVRSGREAAGAVLRASA